MKTILYFFTILALGSALPIGNENEEELLIPLAVEHIDGLTPDQLQCISDSIEQIINDNPQLDWWFNAVNNSINNIRTGVGKCQQIQNPEKQRHCLGLVRIYAKIEKVRLIVILPKDERKIIGVINEAVRTCLNGNENLISVIRDEQVVG